MSTPSLAPPRIAIRHVAPQRYLGKRVHARLDAVGTVVPAAYAELFAALREAHVTPAGMPFLVASEPSGGEMDIELGVPCADPPARGDLIAGTLPGGRVAVHTFTGRYEDIGPVYMSLAEWIRVSGLESAGPPREVHLTGPEDVARPEDHVTEVVWPIV